MIPRIIHQIWLGDKIPPALQENIDRLKALNPTWEHRLYDDRLGRNFIAAVYGDEAAAMYDRIDRRYPAARSDFLRHHLVFAYGGVYCDVDLSFSKPFDALLKPDDSYVVVQWEVPLYQHRALAHVEGGEFLTGILMAEPHHPFTSAVICRMLQNIASYRPWHSVGRNGALKTTGPITCTLAIEPLLKQHPHRFATLWDLGVSFVNYEPPTHYARMTAPIVKLGPAQTIVSRGVTALRWALGRGERAAVVTVSET